MKNESERKRKSEKGTGSQKKQQKIREDGIRRILELNHKRKELLMSMKEISEKRVQLMMH